MSIQTTPDPFVSVPWDLLDNPRLSWAAKGIYAHLAAKPEGGEVRVADLVRIGNTTSEAVIDALHELRQWGWVGIRDKEGPGRYGRKECEWCVNSTPDFSKQ